ncbi:MAG: hypothetical protein JOZ14_13860 [Acidobacteria bacterium]|nr:hypothetical protein [Acidobacteriota bacterium]
MTLAKTFKVGERVGLKLEGAAFNLFNHPNFVLASSGTSNHNNITSSIFGKAGGTLGARVLQVGAKISF